MGLVAICVGGKSGAGTVNRRFGCVVGATLLSAQRPRALRCEELSGARHGVERAVVGVEMVLVVREYENLIWKRDIYIVLGTATPAEVPRKTDVRWVRVKTGATAVGETARGVAKDIQREAADHKQHPAAPES